MIHVSLLPVPGFGSSVPAQRGLHLVKKALRHGWVQFLKMSSDGRQPPPGTTLHVRVMAYLHGNDILVGHYASSVS